MEVNLTIPHNYTPRPYQVPFLRAMDDGYIRAALIWHRRSGKSKTLLNFTMKKAFQRVGTYYHCFPEYGQGRKILWDGIDAQGHRVLDWHIPRDIRISENKSEMKIELRSGSIWQIIGADNYDSVVGANPVGLIMDEWAVSDRYPQAWDYFRPMLAENGGWAVFPYTPRGRNHGFDLYQQALDNKDWFCEVLGVNKTHSISMDAIEAERRAGMPESMIQQEFFCSFLASTEDIVIPYELIQAALDRDVWYGKSPKIAGLDVARFGNDRTALVVRQGGDIVYVETWSQADVVETAGRVLERFKSRLFDAVAVDSIGIGAGVGDLLKSHSLPVALVQVSEKPRDESRFDTQRDELWWKLREWFEEGSCGISKAMMPNLRQAIVKDIQDIHFKYAPSGKIKIESKDDMKKRMGFSPDIGDALCLTFTHKIHMRQHEAQGKRRQFGAENWDRRGRNKKW
ncbi:MAG: hypothetical protein ABIJ57_12095, partial [Pseudomonadota bacterium]